MSIHEEDYQNAKDVVLRFGAYVRVLTYSGFLIQYCSRADLERFMRRYKFGGTVLKRDKFRCHVGLAFDRLQMQHATQIATLKSNEHVARLNFLLQRVPNLLEIRLTPEQSLKALSTIRRRPIEKCEIENGVSSYRIHLNFGFSPSHSSDDDGTSRAFHTVVQAWPRGSSIKLKTLDAMHTGGNVAEYGISNTAFELRLDALQKLSTIFETLTDLKLNLVSNSSGPCSMVCILSATRNLEHLALDHLPADDEDSYVDLLSTLGRRGLPKLRSLALHFFQSTEDELVDFLLRTKIEHLNLHGYDITKGSWENFAERTKGSLPLKSIELVEINAGPYGEDWPLTGEMGVLLAFFYFRDWPNPFSEEMLAIYDDDCR